MQPIPLSIRAEDEPETALMYAAATVDGVADEFLLDTGASRSRVRRSVLGPGTDHVTEASEASATAEASGARGVLGAARVVHRARIGLLAFGPIAARGLSVDVSDDEVHGPGAILGLDVLAGHRLDVLPDARVCAVDADTPVDRIRPLLLSAHGHPHVRVDAEQASALAVWDTGASITIVDTAFVSANPQLFTPIGSAAGRDAHGNAADTALVTMAACRIGERAFAPSLAAVAPIAGIQRAGDPEFAMIAGWPLIAQAAWAIDLRRGTWGFLDAR